MPLRRRTTGTRRVAAKRQTTIALEPRSNRARTARKLLDAIDGWFPGAAASEPLLVDARTIVTYGRTDVDDPASGLHDRTRIGVRSLDGYHSVDPGKLTTKPLFGTIAADRVCARACRQDNPTRGPQFDPVSLR